MSKKGATGQPAILMHGWAVRTAGPVSNRLNFRQFRLLLALEQAASGPAPPFANAGSNLAALIADDRQSSRSSGGRRTRILCTGSPRTRCPAAWIARG